MKGVIKQSGIPVAVPGQVDSRFETMETPCGKPQANIETELKSRQLLSSQSQI